MATKEEHLAKADSNAAFANSLSLNRQVDIDWALTALFYSGLHYVEAYLYKMNAPPGTHDTHGKRNRWIATDPELKSLHREYRDLEYFSRRARYFCESTTAKQVTDEAMPALEKIRTALKAIL